MAHPSNVTRIKASDDQPVTKPAKSSKTATSSEAQKSSTKAAKISKAHTSHGNNIFWKIGGYFKGAWQELRQVRWPNRQATWGLTVAVILFSLFFGIVILSIDALFKYLFQLVIQ